MDLSHVADDIKILRALDERGGSTTGQVSVEVFPDPGDGGRQRMSAHVRRRLAELQRQGFVRHLDDQKPVCWCRTAAGTNAINSGNA